MKILVINAGSSSLKYQLIETDSEEVLAKGLCERIGLEGSKLTHSPENKDSYVKESPMPDHNVAVQMVLEALIDPDHGVRRYKRDFRSRSQSSPCGSALQRLGSGNRGR